MNFQLYCQMTRAIVYMYFIREGFKKKVPQWLKKISSHFDHYNLINKEESTVQIWYKSIISINFMIPQLDLPNNALYEDMEDMLQKKLIIALSYIECM